jgi:uncharacterized protein YkwD
MHASSRFKLLSTCFALLGLAGAVQVQAHPALGGASPALTQAVAQVRAQGCPGRGGANPLRPLPQLDEAARRIADGLAAAEALKSVGYRAVRTFQVNMSGQTTAAALAQTLAANYCEPLSSPQLTDLGVHQRGNTYWMLVTAPFSPPPASAAGEVAARVLALTNQARSQPRRCGNESLPAAPPLAANPVLDRAAAAHAQEMARHSFMAHEGRDGSAPADRITRAGYVWRSIGENVAAGQTTADDVVRDWLKSPGHCANLMSAKFTEMGIAYAVNPGSQNGMYWAQTFGRPR